MDNSASRPPERIARERLSVSPEEIREAARRIGGVAHRTPVLTSRTADERTGGSLFFKCENFQRAGAFKFRGAYNALTQLDAEAKERGVLTYSSGNHAQALALAGRMLDIPVTVIMPQSAPQVKIDATRGYGAEIVFYDPQKIAREALTEKIARERALPVIPPYDHPHIVAGQGTAALELFEDAGDLDFLLVPCGGGGLLSGCALGAALLCPSCKVIGVEPESADDACRSFRTGTLQTVHHPSTIADGARTPCLGKHTFPIVRHYVHDMVAVSDDALKGAMAFFAERMKIVVEPTGALAAAAIFEKIVPVSGARVGIVLSGGNVDLKSFGELIQPPSDPR